MNVHIHQQRIKFNEQDRHRMPITGKEILIGRPDDADEKTVLYRPRIDKEILMLRAGAIEGRQSCKAADTNTIALGLNTDGIVAEFPSKHSAQASKAGLFALLGLKFEKNALIRLKMKGDIRPGEREPANHVGDGLHLRAFCFHELQSGGGSVKQVPYIHTRSVGRQSAPGSWSGPLNTASVDQYLRRPLRVRRTTDNRQARHSAYRGKRLSAEAHRPNIEEIDIAVLGSGQFGGGMAFDGKGQLAGGHPLTVVFYQNSPQAAALNAYPDRQGPCIKSILNKLLGSGGRPFNDLAGGDTVDGRGRQPADADRTREC
jgi:hypothetical protein